MVNSTHLLALDEVEVVEKDEVDEEDKDEVEDVDNDYDVTSHLSSLGKD